MQDSQRYKLYKHGKNWVTAALVGMTVVSGVAAINVATNNHVTSVAAARAKVNKAGLVKQLGYAKVYKASGYTAASFNKLQSDIRLATGVLNNARASQASVNWFVDLLHKDAINLVKQARVDKSGLVKQIGWSKAYQAKNYTAASFSKLQNDLKTANTVLNNAKATQGDVTWITNVLHNDGVALVKAVNFAGLQQQLGWSMRYQANDYTEGPYAILIEDIESAKALLANKNASQQAISDMIIKLHADGLGLVPVEKTSQAAQKVLNDTYFNLMRQFTKLAPYNQFADYVIKATSDDQEDKTISQSINFVYLNFAFHRFEDTQTSPIDGKVYTFNPLPQVETSVTQLYSALYNIARTNQALNAKDDAGMSIQQHLTAAVNALKTTHPNASANGQTLTVGALKSASYLAQMQAFQNSVDSILAGFDTLANNNTSVAAQAALQNDLKQIDDSVNETRPLTDASLDYLSSADKQTLSTAIASAKKVAGTNGLTTNDYVTANTAYKAAVKQAFLTASKFLVNSAKKDFGMSLQDAYKKSFATELVDTADSNGDLFGIAYNIDPKNDVGVAGIVQDFINAVITIGGQGKFFATALAELDSAHKTDPLYLKLQSDLVAPNGIDTQIKPGVTNYQVFADAMNYLNKYPDTHYMTSSNLDN